MDKGTFPSSPILDITVRNNTGASCDAKGLIDTGADRTLITNDIIKWLSLKSKGKREMQGIGGKIILDVYSVYIGTDSTRFEKLVVYGPHEEMLIGRDLIRRWRLEINGCKDTFSIEPCFSSP